MRYFIFVVLFSLLPRLAWADPPAPLVAVPPGDDVIVPIKKGDPAPFSGQLWDVASALRWANFLQQCHFRLQADVEYQKKYDGASLEFAHKQLELERTEYARVTTELQAKLTDAQKQLAEGPPWYKTATFGILVGVVATIAAVGATAALVNATK